MKLATNGTSTQRPIPAHLAIIMDGNHRWARRRGLPGSVGHRVGAKNVRPIAEVCADLGIKYLTLFAFSTENWSRPQAEIELLFELIATTLNENLDELHDRDTKVRYIGDLTRFPSALEQRLRESEQKTAQNRSLTLTIALNYGGQADIVRAAQKISQAVRNEELDPETIDEDVLESHLSTHGIPHPDFCIRTGGDQRLSNFLLWQLAYAELYFSDRFWPEFRESDLKTAIADYRGRERRYGHRVQEPESLHIAS